MGYGEKKRKIEKKGMLIKRILLGVLLVCLLGLCIFSHFYPPESWKYYVSKPNVSRRKSGELRIDDAVHAEINIPCLDLSCSRFFAAPFAAVAAGRAATLVILRALTRAASTRARSFQAEFSLPHYHFLDLVAKGRR